MLSKKINRKKGVGEGVHCHRCSCCIAAAGAVAAASAAATPTPTIVCLSSVLLLIPARLWVHPPCAYAVVLVPATWSCMRLPLPLFVHPHPHLRSSMLTLPLVPAQLCVHPSLCVCACLPSPPFAHPCAHLCLSTLGCTGPHYLV